jgi:hypothetical protein
MKHFSIALIAFIFLIALPEISRAEFVFKKDGAIIKGAVLSDEVTTISVKDESGAVVRIERQDILRIIYTDLYLGKVYARLTTGEVIEGYQVFENRDNFFFRKDIAKPEEMVVARRKVLFIARTNPTDLRGMGHTDSIDLSWSPPFKPAKYYRVFIRDVKKQEESFRLAAETSDQSFTVKGLHKSWSYEFYATAVADTGEESLPSEKVVVCTLPDAPQNLVVAEKLASDGKTVALTFSWKNVDDADSRVRSYAIYEVSGNDRRKKGVSNGNEFVLNGFPAEGRHWFAVVAVNDDFTESSDIKAVWDAGYRVSIRGMGSYVYPIGSMKTLATSGYGGLLDIGISGRNLCVGIETGGISFCCAEDVKQMIMVPALIEVEYRLPLFWVFSLRPFIKAGGCYDMIGYVSHDAGNPLIVGTKNSSSFDGMASAGAYLQADITDKIYLFGGVEYATLFQTGGMMNFASCSFGAGIVF